MKRSSKITKDFVREDRNRRYVSGRISMGVPPPPLEEFKAHLNYHVLVAQEELT